MNGRTGVAGFSGVPGFSADHKYGGRPLPSGRVVEKAREGRPCQLPYLVGAGEDQVLSRWNMVEPKNNVSPYQCVVQCAADGTAALVSEGEAPTLVRATGGTWDALYTGESRLLDEGDQVSLDCDDPEGAVSLVSNTTPPPRHHPNTPLLHRSAAPGLCV